MSPIKKNLFIFSLVLFSIIISTFIWKKLHIPYNSDIIGEYSLKNYSSLNDIIKYLSFILLPLFTFLLAKILIEKINLINQLENLKIKNIIEKKNDNYKNFIFLLILFIILEFISIGFPVEKLDIFHSGQKLYPSFKYDLDHNLWSDIYIISGTFIEIFSTKIAWDLFSIKTIGASRFADLFLVLLTKIILIFLTYEISKSINYNKSLKLFLFLILSLFSLYLLDYNLNSADLISARDLPILLSLYLFFSLINNSFNKSIISFCIGIIAVLIFIWGLDRAIVNTALISFILIILALNKFLKELIIICFSMLLSLIFLIFYFDNEFNFFIENSFLILKEMTNIHGLIHPLPFSNEPNASRATKTLLLILLSMLISFNILISNNSKIHNNLKIILFSISLLSFFTYIYAIGRSDGGHIRQAFGFPIFFIFIYLFIILLNLINKFVLSKNILTNKSNLFSMILILIFVININFNFSNMTSFKNRLNNYLEKDDLFYLTESDAEFISEARLIVNDFNCIQLYTNDSALLYLLKKQSCSKYYWPWSYGSEQTQKQIINKLENNEIIITNGISDNWGVPFEKKFIILDPYIKENFSNKIIKIGQREIRFKN